MNRLDHVRRLASAYVLGRNSHVSFWRERPAAHPRAFTEPDSFYPMTFADKAGYEGPYDDAGVPILDYHGSVGRQYNPIAIAQFALAWLNRGAEGATDAVARWRGSAEWLTDELHPNASGVPVWVHRFDWPYRETLRNPWYSGLAQGQGVSALLRAARAVGETRYRDAAERAYRAIVTPIADGGVLHVDERGDPWIEEYLVSPPSHILNGFIWALWGVRDMARLGGDPRAKEFFDRCVGTIERNLERYDTGYWSMYEIRPSGAKMLASPFYHSLHIVQLEIMAELTRSEIFAETARRWRRYTESRIGKSRAVATKAIFKLFHY